ncbi:MAG TPA: hypothetical protein DIU00_01465 [Phycisphaerales bacterium]|nr:hypothetical protein [Phycisphaerales bacterium]
MRRRDMKGRIQLVRLQELQEYRLGGIGQRYERKKTNAFSKHRLFSALFIICLIATPKLSFADDNHDWNASAYFSTEYDSGLRIVLAHLSWEEPPKPDMATGLSYRISHEGGGGNIISWGNTSGFMRIWQGWCDAVEFEVIVENIISQPQRFTIELNYYVNGWSSIYHSFTWEPPPLEASEPDPADGTVVISPPGEPLEFKWSPGRKASTHDVYFSDNFQDVNEGTEDAFLGNLLQFPIIGTPESDYPNALIPGKTYYWRTDEINDDGTKFEGDVWSFWIKPPIPITDPNLFCWWTFDLSEGTHIIDWSGHDHDGTIGGESQLVDGYDGRALRTITEGDFVKCSLDQASDWPAGTVAFWVKADTAGQDAWSGVFNSYFSSSAGFQIDVDGGNPGNYQVDPGGLTFGAVATDWVHLALSFEGSFSKLYYNGSLIESGTLEDTKFNQFTLGINRNTVNSFSGIFDDLQIYDCALTQDEIKQLMRIKRLIAWEPGPSNGSIPDIEQATPLVWSPGDNASQHDIYFGSNHSRVVNANTFDTSGVYRGRQNPVVYTPPEALESGRTYYWRIDEINSGNASRKGDIWSFTIRPKIAYRPYPSNGCKLRQQNVTLSWMPGSAGRLHDVYFGTELNRVNSANTSDTSGIYQGRGDRTSYTPDQLDRGRNYYWRIDEVEANGTKIHKGNVWSFMVVNFETLEYQVSSSKDDVYAASEDLQNIDFEFLKVGSSSFAQLPYYTSGMVFRNLNIPKGAEIISSYLKVQSYNSRLSGVVYGKIQAEAVDNAVEFGGSVNIGSLDKTGTSIDWDIDEAWSADTWYTSPDITGVIQEVINRNGWSDGNSLAIIYSTRLHEGGYRNISSFDRGSDYAPILEITFIP